MNINLRQLQAFVSAYRLGSLTRAAERMSVTQPTVSVLIRQFEESVGVRLFDRTTRSLRPTAAAHDSIDRAERILGEFAQLTEGFADVSRLRRGRLVLGATPAVASALVPPALLVFRRQFPRVDVTIRDLAPEHLVSSVASEAVELSLGTPQGPSPEVDLTPLIEDTMCVICTRDSPLVRRRRITWSEIAGHPTVTVRKGSGIRTIIDDTLGRLGLSLEPIYEVSYLATALSLTQHGLGISVLPSYLTRYFHSGRLVAVKLVDPVVRRNLCIVQRRGASLSPAAASFIAILRSQVAHDAVDGTVAADRAGPGRGRSRDRS